ncbi:MAG: hypothetical protein PUC44_04565 [Eubacteriales bacterium]|nr:hypothetical protein [Eubacteriales bacterium]
MKDLCLRDRNVREIADKYGVSSYSIYNWAWQKFGKGNLLVKKRAFKSEDKRLEELKKDNERLKRENVELERHNHYLPYGKRCSSDSKQIAKKEQGISLMKLTNREKIIVIDALCKECTLWKGQKQLLLSVAILHIR